MAEHIMDNVEANRALDEEDGVTVNTTTSGPLTLTPCQPPEAVLQ